MNMRLLVVLLMLVPLGCQTFSTSLWARENRSNNDLLIVLSGVEGKGITTAGIEKGLKDSNVQSNVQVYRWGWPVPLLGMAMNQTDLLMHRAEARRIARKIVQYQQEHSDAEIDIVGHSAGGGLAIYVAEAMGKMPYKPKLRSLVLLSPSISSGYNYSKALVQCSRGIVNFYNSADETLLIGTALFGNIDGGRGPSAGRVGFEKLYRSNDAMMLQVPVTPEMISNHLGPVHAVTSSANFVSLNVSPWLKTSTWPPADKQ